ncbi:MAG TPA: type IV toxin-antitoxin system AbiEi family antitoxin domain-containing protein [Acidimicrobiia bacterium]|nr:type IV toxin-antitoxin system AbiEi family antitoxin domain-containing protein [Acidimicrobiia bacterium]
MSDRYRRVYNRALANGGVITRSELAELDITPRMIESRVASGQWTIVARGVYRLAEAFDRRDLRRSVLAAWPGAVLSHESAAAVHGFSHVTEDRVVVSHHSRTTHRFTGVVVRRTHDLDAWHVVEVDGLRVTTIARTLVDLAAGRPVALIGRIVDDLVAAERVALFEIGAVLDAVARRGKPGVGTMRKVIEVRSGPAHSGTVLERQGRRVISEAGLPAPLPEHPVPWTTGRRFDDAYPDLRLAIEWDSRRFHGQLASFEADRARDRDAAIHGWRILRFTWDDVTRHPHRIVDALRSLLVG